MMTGLTMAKRRRLAVLTSGGDAPGMNAAIRAVVRVGARLGADVFGVKNGYAGLLRADLVELGPRSVSGIVQLGGTFLGTSRVSEFSTHEARAPALEALEKFGIGTLVVIGGNGTQSGAAALAHDGARVIGVTSTIDNDVVGCDVSIGATSALDVALESIDRLKVTASSIGRAFLVEVMGRASGYLALSAGIAGGAEAVVVPERSTTVDDLADCIRRAYETGKGHALLVVAEGAALGTDALASAFLARQAELGFEIRVTKIGHVQRGAAPGAFDRLLASRLGAAAAERALSGEYGVLVGLHGQEVLATPLAQVAGRTKPVPEHLFDLARLLG
jgi:6-phosphofructokinase 1